MATKYASFSDNYRPATGYAYQDYYIDIGYTETYNQAEKRSEVTLEVVQEKTTFSPGNCRFSGIVKFQTTGGTTVVTKTLYDSSSDITLMADSWSDVSNSSGGTGYIPYNTDGTASFVVRLEANQYTNFGAVFSGRALGIQSSNLPATLTVALPTHTSKLTINPNGGTWGSSTSSQSFNQLPKTTKTIANPTRTGYTFGGWTRSGSTTGSISGTTYTFGDDATTTTLTASWTPITYTVSYKKGDNGTGTDTTDTKTYGVALTLKGAIFTRTGYTQDGWSTKSDGSTKDYNLSASYTTNAAITLYPHWSANTYTVKFNANGGSGTMSNESFTYNVSKALTSNAFTKTGYTFKGWDTNSNGTTVVYTNGQTVKNLATSGTVNLYAVWQINTWTVSYNANGGSGAPSSQTKTYNVTLVLSSTIPTKSSVSAGSYSITYNANGGSVSPTSATAARTTSYSFSKWNTKSDGSGTNYNAGGNYTANAAATLYAQWSSTTTTASVTLPTPTRTGYTFKGWATSSTATTGVTGSYTPTGNVTLYAIWQVKTYTLSISQGTGSTISVIRNGTALSNGATISHFDVLSITISANTGYNIGTHTVNGTNWTSGNYTVSGNVSVISTASLITYTLSVTTSQSGVTTTITRTSSPIGHGSTSTITNGATLYYNDVLSINYTIGGAYQLTSATVNNTDISNVTLPYSVTVKQNIVVSVSAKLGAIVYIGNEAYQAFIGNGSSWIQYQAYIGNGTSFDQY